MKDAVKRSGFIKDAINLSHEELKKKFKEAVDNNRSTILKLKREV